MCVAPAGARVWYGRSWTLPELQRVRELNFSHLSDADVKLAYSIFGGSARSAPLPLLSHGARVIQVQLYMRIGS